MVTTFLIPIPLGLWGYVLGRYLKFAAGGTGIARLLPFTWAFIGAIVGVFLGLFFPAIVHWAFSKAGL
ncbi:MAG: hypothetical protein KME17_16175 [Cyanosarcina radialis HA8281-LM2]|nr:hypothetical protein [Cyanosarcina radialis HA8281-LM2]